MGESSLRLMFAAEGDLHVTGYQSWDVTLSAPRSCAGLEEAAPCERGALFTSPLLFTQSRHLLSCQGQTCGSCDCSGVIDEGRPPGFSWALGWTTAASQLTLSPSDSSFVPRSVPYCVQGDVLWVGGGEVDGQTLTAYRFRKRSCTQTLPACEERAFEECEETIGCRWGACLPTPGSGRSCNGFYESQCAEYAPDCAWHALQCSSSGVPNCEFHRCEEMPGCELGPPVARCVGDASCREFEANECNEPGCSVRTCAHAPFSDDLTSCGPLTVTFCGQAPGCSSDGVQCEGTTNCSAQTDDFTCDLLGCEPEAICWGLPTRTCSSLPVEDCHTLPGCRVEW
jgi:hypothetical protein